jgi:hypothetical protein
VFTWAQCRTIAEQKLAQAEHDDRHRRRLTTAAQAWLFLASRLSEEEPTTSTQLTAIEASEKKVAPARTR